MPRITKGRTVTRKKEVSVESCRIAEVVIEERPGQDSEKSYLVKWQGYPPEESTWEPFENLSTLLFTNWVIDRWELEQIIREVDGEEHTRESRPSSSVLYSQAISEDVENILYVWAQGGDITY